MNLVTNALQSVGGQLHNSQPRYRSLAERDDSRKYTFAAHIISLFLLSYAVGI